MTFRGASERTLLEDWMKDVPGFDSGTLEPEDRITYTVSYPTPKFAEAVSPGASAETSMCQGGDLACPCSAAL